MWCKLIFKKRCAFRAPSVTATLLASLVASRTKRARNLEKIGVTQELLSDFVGAEGSFKAAMDDRLDVYFNGDSEDESRDEIRKRQIEYIARLQTNLSLLRERIYGDQVARSQEVLAVEQVASLDKGRYLPEYFRCRLTGLRRIGNTAAIARLKDLAAVYRITLSDEKPVKISTWMQANGMYVGGSSKQRALFKL